MKYFIVLSIFMVASSFKLGETSTHKTNPPTLFKAEEVTNKIEDLCIPVQFIDIKQPMKITANNF